MSLGFHSPGVLTINGNTSITFANQTSAADFADGAFGIKLVDAQPEATLMMTGTDHRDEMAVINPGVNQANWSLAFSSFTPDSPEGVMLYTAPFPASAPVMDISGGGGNDFLFGFVRRDVIRGGDGDDIIMGDLGSWNGKPVVFPEEQEGDLLAGGAGNDVLYGGEGSDRLYGGALPVVFRVCPSPRPVSLLSPSLLFSSMQSSQWQSWIKTAIKTRCSGDTVRVFYA